MGGWTLPLPMQHFPSSVAVPASMPGLQLLMEATKPSAAPYGELSKLLSLPTVSFGQGTLVFLLLLFAMQMHSQQVHLHAIVLFGLELAEAPLLLAISQNVHKMFI